MAKQKTSQRYVFKIHSKRLREAKWNLTLSLREARENHELISLADSQALRFIDDLNGNRNEEERIRSIRREITRLKQEPSSAKVRNQIRRLYDELDALQFKPDYINIVIDKKSDYLRAVKGFRVNNIPYMRLLGTTGGIKNSTIVFVSKRVGPELQRRIDNGRDMTKEFVPAKLEAYRALVCSGSIPVSDPGCVLVVPDCVTHFRDRVTMLDDSAGGEPVMTTLENYESELNCSDGFGLMTYELARRWSEELNLELTASGFCIRNSFCKGMVFPFPLREFCRKVAIPAGKSNMVQDVWGDWQDINRVELILTASMLKLWDSYESCEDYLYNCRQNGYTFAVTKTCTLTLENERRLNYQFIQSYRLDYEQIQALVKPTCDEIRDVMGGDWRKALLFLCGEMRDEDGYVKKLPNDIVKALMIEPELIHDPHMQKIIQAQISKKIDDAKIGRIKVHGNYQVLSGDPYALCQSMFGLEVTGLLKAGEIYSRYWADEGVPEVMLFRAPMSCHANIRKMGVAAREEARYWYQYMKTVTVLNCWDNTCAALNGADRIKV